jgi:O-antigen/teichoic acid export membrane protein
MFRNTLAQAVTFLSAQVYSFLLAPIMIDRLGLTLFGVWTVVGSIATYISVLDPGVSRALSRFIAVYDSSDDRRSIQECMGLGLLVITGITALLLPIAWFAGPPLADVLGHVDGAQMRQLLLAQAVIFIVQGYSAVLQGLSQGLRRTVPANTAVVLGNSINFGASVFALLTAHSLVRYAWFNAGAETIGAILVVITIPLVWRGNVVRIPSRRIIRQVLAYSLRSQITWIADVVNLQTDKLVIGLLVGPAAAGIYQLASSVASAVRNMGVISIGMMIPTTAAAITTEGRTAVRRMAVRYMPLVLGVSFPIFVVSALGAPFVFTLWLGSTGDHGVVPILIALDVVYAINVATGVPSTVALADGRTDLTSRNAISMAGFNAVLTLGLAPVFGLAGVVAGTVVAVGSFSIGFIVRFARTYGLTLADMREAIEPAALLAVVTAVPFVAPVLATAHLGDTRVRAGVLLAMLVACYGAVYWPLASWLGILPQRLALRWPAKPSAAA